MSEAPQRYTQDVRRQAVALALEVGLPSASTQLNIPLTTLRNWVGRGQGAITAAQASNLRFVSRTHRSLMDTRRKYEWRVFASTVAFFISGAATVLIGSKPIRVLTFGESVGVVVVEFLLAFASIVYLKFIHGANAANKRIAEEAEDQLVPPKRGKNAPPSESNASTPLITASRFTELKRYLRDEWSLVWQASFIALTALVSTFVVCSVRFTGAA